jgi:TonB-linked SusC/RagA family outer membrane protein
MIIAKQKTFFCKEKLRKKIVISMKLVSTIMLLFILQLSVQAKSQNKITLKLKNVELTKAISMIESQSEYRFVYNNSLIPESKTIDANFREADLPEVMTVVLNGTGLSYKMMKSDLVVLYKPAVDEVKTLLQITGKVTDENGSPLQGASVKIKGTSNGTSTDNAGSFSLNVADNAVLVISYVGYEAKEIPVGGRTDISVQLSPSIKVAEQVVVVGYGTQKRKDLTGSVASVSGNELAKQPVTTATEALQGKVAGVQIISSGQPNSLPTVRIRGTGSMLGGANPLYVVDGVITDDIRNINSADIVSMDVLKDASATAIYGMRAANGVLIITTKKGRVGKMIVSYDASLGIKEASHLVNMAGPNQYANYKNEANIYYGTGDSLITSAKLRAGGNTDWFDAITRRGFWQNHNVSLSGGSDKVTYFLSAGYIGEEGIVQTNKFERFTLRSNNEYKISKAIKVSTLISYSRANLRDINLGVFNEAYRAAPYVASKVGDQYGNTSLSNNVGNPLISLDKSNSSGIDNRLQSTVAIDIKPLKWLTFRSSFGSDLDFYSNTAYSYQFANSGSNSVFFEQGGNEVSPKSSLNIARNNATRWVWDNTLTATKSFGLHNFTLLAGTTAEQFKFNSVTGSRTDVPADQNQWYLGTGTQASANNDNTGDKYTRNSYIGRLNYNYDDRYLLTATIRADGTSKFAAGNHWGYFPSVGIGWNLTKESFLSSQTLFDNLKLRASYGQVGNDQIPSNTYLNIASIGLPYFYGQPGTQSNGIAFTQLPDPNVKWEVTKEYDLGLDFALLKNRLSGEIDYYDKKVSDALINIVINATLPDADGKYTTNAASFSNKGVELSLNWKDRISNKVTYNIGGNVAYNKNKITGLNGGQALSDGGNSQGFTTLSDNGVPIGSFYLLQFDGIFKNDAEIAASAQKDARPGDIRYKDISGPDGKPDGKITDADRAFSGSYQPKLTFGLNGGVTYESFDFNFGAYGTAGGKIYNGKKQSVGTDPRDNIETKIANGRWTPNNPSNTIPRASLGTLPNSTYFLEKGDFLRINNVTIGYTLGDAMLSRYHISKLRIYATAQNLATITGYSGFSPEIPGDNPLNGGIEINAYPTTRTFAFGINLSF